VIVPPNIGRLMFTTESKRVYKYSVNCVSVARPRKCILKFVEFLFKIPIAGILLYSVITVKP
jgi:hypothetical protein